MFYIILIFLVIIILDLSLCDYASLLETCLSTFGLLISILVTSNVLKEINGCLIRIIIVPSLKLEQFLPLLLGHLSSSVH